MYVHMLPRVAMWPSSVPIQRSGVGSGHHTFLGAEYKIINGNMKLKDR